MRNNLRSVILIFIILLIGALELTCLASSQNHGKFMNKKKYGQYFTPEAMANFMISLSKKTSISSVLEPSAGEGVFIELLKKRGFKDILGFEIDKELADQHDCVRFESFVSAELPQKYDLAIGNPPYIRWKNLEPELKKELETSALWAKYFNSLCDYSYIFILKCVENLKDGGELIFICPEYWMNTTNSLTLRNYLLENGYFTDFYIFNETPIFKDATVSTVVFRYVKSMCANKPKINVAKFLEKGKITSTTFDDLLAHRHVDGVQYMEITQFKQGKRWVFLPDEERIELEKFMSACAVKSDLFNENPITTIGDVCDIGNGMVSGCDKAFQIPNRCSLNNAERDATINVYKAKDLKHYFAGQKTRYINVPEEVTDEDEFVENYPHYAAIMAPYKKELKERYSYNRAIPYWQWVFKRNEKLFSRGEPRVFVPCKERISSKDYVRFVLVGKGYYPTQDVTALFRKKNVKECIEYIYAYLNHPLVFCWIKNYGIVKGNIVEFSEKPLASIPFRKIDWSNKDDVVHHDNIVKMVREMLKNENTNNVAVINKELEALWK